MKRTVSLLLFVALLALAGCGSSGATAATVNGHDISSDDVVRGAHGFGKSALFRQQLSQQGVDLEPTGSVPTAFAAQWLVSLIQSEAISQYAAKKHVKASDQEVTQAAPAVLRAGLAERRRVQPAAEVVAEPARGDHRAPARAAVVAEAVGERREAGRRVPAAEGRLPEQEADRAHPRPHRRGRAAGRRPRERRRELRHGGELGVDRHRLLLAGRAPHVPGRLAVVAARRDVPGRRRSGAGRPDLRAGADAVRVPRDRGARAHARERPAARARCGAGRRPARAGHRQVPQAVQDHGEPALRQDLTLGQLVHDRPADAEEGPQRSARDAVDHRPGRSGRDARRRSAVEQHAPPASP